MGRLAEIWRRALHLRRRGDNEKELAEEMRHHLEMKMESNIQDGMSVSEARSSAQREFGNQIQLREQSRGLWGWKAVEDLIGDMRFALRTLAKNPGFTAIAVLVLALGIGATTAIFSVVNAVLIRPLPYKDSARLIAISTQYRQAGTDHMFPTVSLNEVEAWRRESHSLDSIGSFVFSALPVNVGQQSMFLVAIGADPEFLATLGANFVVGRNISGTGSSEKDPSVVISHRLWVEAFHSDPAAVGRSMMVDGELYTVTGVLATTFQFPRSDASYFPEEPDILYPVANIAEMWGRDSTQWFAIGRLKASVTVAQAEAELRAINSRVVEQKPAMRGMSVHAEGLDAETTGNVRPGLLLMLGISIVLLLIACTNIMNLLFSRAAARRREMAVRKAVGATTARLVRQMLTESACLTFIAGIVGVGLARVVLDALVNLSPAHLPISGEVEIDLTVLGFAFVVCALATVVAGIFPALHSSRQTENLVHTGTRASGGRAIAHFQQVLMVTQVALGVALLTAAGLLTHSLMRLSSVDAGFKTAGVMGFELAIPSNHAEETGASEAHAARTKRLFQRMLEDTRSIPGVLSAGWITNLPPETRSGMFMPFSIAGMVQPSKVRPFCNFQVTSEDYFQTVGIPLVRGRDFTAADGMGAPPVVIVNEALERQYFKDTSALGQKILTMFDSKDAPRQVIGIIRDTHDRGLNAKSIATAYVPYEQFAQAYGSIALRTDMPAGIIFPEIRRRLAQIDPTVPLKNLTTISARISRTLDEPRFYAFMAGACALMAVLFVTLGLYGVVAYSVARRTSEIGIRMALGAPRDSILRGVLWQGLQMAAFGIAFGLALSLAATHILTKLLFEIKPNDPVTLVAAGALVLLVTLAASYIPARRASKVDPMVALRYE